MLPQHFNEVNPSVKYKRMNRDGTLADSSQCFRLSKADPISMRSVNSSSVIVFSSIALKAISLIP